MEKIKPLIHKKYKLEKFPGKGGWTYIPISETIPSNLKKNGRIKVRGFIDSFELKDHNLFPMGKGKLLMAVKSEIRKIIGKEEGDTVMLKLYFDEPENNVHDEFLTCLQEDPEAHKNYLNYPAKTQKEILAWIEAAKNEEVKVIRIARVLDLLAFGKIMKLS